jgi:release factor glutamine methyltransferase
VTFWQGDLLEPLVSAVHAGNVPQPGIITANPPYLTDNEVESLTDRGWPEPALALAAGRDGLDVIRRLVRQAVTCLVEDGYLLVETGADQGEAVRAILKESGFTAPTTVKDLAGRDRLCMGRWSTL